MNGTASLADVLASVNMLRILSRRFSPGWFGDTIAASLGVDNIQAAGDGGDIPPVPDGTFGSPMLASPEDPAGSVIVLTWDVSTC